MIYLMLIYPPSLTVSLKQAKKKKKKKRNKKYETYQIEEHNTTFRIKIQKNLNHGT